MENLSGGGSVLETDINDDVLNVEGKKVKTKGTILSISLGSW